MKDVASRVGRTVERRRVRVPVTIFLVGLTAGCWVGYVLVYPVSSLPLPKYSVVATVLLGGYLDAAAETMEDRLLGVLAAGLLSYVTGFVIYAFPALIGWYSDPLVTRSLYLSGLREAFIFALLAGTLLLVGTFISYIGRNTYAEITR